MPLSSALELCLPIPDGTEHPIGYASRSLSPAECNHIHNLKKGAIGFILMVSGNCLYFV